MPLVRIDALKRDDPTFIKKVGDIVYESLRSAISIPENDHFQILNEHDDDHLIYDKNYMGMNRTKGFLFIQMTINEGRTLEQKKLLFKTIATRLENDLNILPDDIFINIVEVKKENWSLGNGIAQYAL